jgi:outer membrane protein TolC
VGKADILSLVQAESLLSNAREQLISSKLNLILSKALLEKITGVESLETIDNRQ